ncbi:hypothetical protein H310_08418 [Aphanomyces invadans]|uniref:Tc1-like transposase DDE domain-containing protein n=1 Tax=Aphanomyces invadans TaxID=157072 RepID=A0A024TZ91_9STRA|nr:hypothetical protein H310_08418 [Aphanomyces invadans]ETV98931.1 hypothetical protein H310_08418 [Aphanomyces invadans]|eukprot:XP_008872359.1 hypothetical protein H310_08418 [Aphanomyces invadans]
MVRQFIRKRSLTRVRTVAKDVMVMLLEAGIIALVQVYLEKLGFKRGKQRGHATYKVSSAHAALRDVYIDRMTDLSPDTPVVYLDESYIHHHYARHDDNLYDPSDDAPLKEKHKGHIFEGSKRVKDDPKVYHGMFDHTYFVKWFKAAMDEVEFHGKMGVRYGVDVESHDLKKTIWARFKPVLSARVEPMVVTMARDRGHDVLFTPPHHSDLQPIEMVWAKAKGDVGVQYKVDTTFADVRARLDDAFKQLPSAMICNCIRHFEKLVDNIYELFLARESDSADDLTSDSSSGTSDNNEDL